MKNLFLRLWSHINLRRRKQIGLLFLLMLLASMGEVISIGAIVPFLGVLTAPDSVFSSAIFQPVISLLEITEPHQLLLPLTLVFVVAALLSGLLRLILLWGQTRLSNTIGVDLGYEIYRRTLYQPYSQHVARNSSEVISGIAQKTDSVVGQTIFPFLVILSSALMMIMIVVTLFAINPVVALVALIGFGVIYGLIVFLTKSKLIRNSRCISQMANQRIKVLQEGLGGIRDVLLDRTQPIYCRVYREAEMPMRHAQASNQFIAGAPRFGVEALGMVLIAGLAFHLSVNGTGVSNAIPVLGALALGAQRLLPILQQGYSSWSSIRGGQASLSDALDLLEQPMPAHMDALQPASILFERSIHVKQLSFRYVQGAPWVLRNFELVIPKGSCVGFIGTTGSGKSTLLDVLMGLLVSDDGQLFVDDILINEENYPSWQAHIAHVPQTIFLADASVAENIAFGLPPDEIDLTRLQRAAQQAQIAETIEGFEKQYDTPVGERGIRLSGGQRQRIGIARALYKNANVIIFDEATSALDSETERAVMDEIKRIDREITILMVAHRLTTLSGCDKIVELDRGAIKRIGTYSEIVSKQKQ